MSKTHGMRRTPEYDTWQHIINRCENQKCDKWQHYGGRGVRIAPEWRHDFAAFYAHVGPRPSAQHSIDRIDPEGHYEPGNVRWADRKQQRANRRSTAGVSTYWRGKKHAACAGELNSKAKLTAENVRHIRRLRAEIGLPLASIARNFGVSAQTIHGIVTRKTWAHVE